MYDSRIYFYTNGSCHGHDCMIVGFTSTYGSCHGHDCMIVGFTSTYGSDHDCMIVRCTSIPMVAVMVMIV